MSEFNYHPENRKTGKLENKSKSGFKTNRLL
jgi:hypothetical protein